MGRETDLLSQPGLTEILKQLVEEKRNQTINQISIKEFNNINYPNFRAFITAVQIVTEHLNLTDKE